MKVLLPLLISTLIFISNADGDVTCAGTGMNWYTSHVGETACKTYERLRQICNPSFEVGTMSVTSLAPDICNDENAICCCNSIAFALAMLCLNCQQDIPGGYDAEVGAYENYLQGDLTSGFCSPVITQTLATTVQVAVCNQDIKIFDELYSLVWDNGAWFYAYTVDTISESIAAQNTINTTSSALLSALSTSTSSSPTPTSTSSDNLPLISSLKVSAIVGIVFGVIAGLAVSAIMMWYLCRKRFINRPVLLEPWPFIADKREAYIQPVGDPYPPGLLAGYRGPRTKARNFVPSQPNARPSLLKRGLQMDSNQNPSISLTAATVLGLSSGSSPHPPGGHISGQSFEVFTARELERDVDAGPVPQEMLNIILPPAYGDQID